ncbi:polysaccharide deacetylase family protein [Halomonas denitrificans]|nr:polysaccharide deacetylase family protein [Halomonas denitrificans]
MKLLVSIHDVMPETIDRVRRIFDRLIDARMQPVTLLVVPGRDWSSAAIDELRTMVSHGAELAGHGWTHKVERINGVKHALHSALISRRAGEHLALSRIGILRLMLKNRAWFETQGLPAPRLYVPPAWAMGPVPRTLLRRLPFDVYETTGGVYDATADRFLRLPMAGFETDTAFRAAVVRPFNALNRFWARRSGRPLRLGIHPDDFELRLADDLEAMIAAGGECLSYRELA